MLTKLLKKITLMTKMMICEFNQFTDEEEFEGFHNEEDEDVAKVIIKKQCDFDDFLFVFSNSNL